MINGVGGIVGDAVNGEVGKKDMVGEKLEYWSRMRLDEEWEKVVEGRSSE